jgi:hypothetical protein
MINEKIIFKLTENTSKTKMKDAQTQNSPELLRKNNHQTKSTISGTASINFNLLDIPSELACVYSKLDGKNIFLV